MSAAAEAGRQSLKSMIKRVIGPRLANFRHLFGAPLAYRPGHFYSPICAPEAIADHYRAPEDLRESAELPGIDLNEAGQRQLWADWADYFSAVPFRNEPQPGLRYHYDNRNFGPGDAIVLHCMLRHFRPSRVIEIGSGYSTACTLDTIEHFLGGSTHVTCIEPYPALLEQLLSADDLGRIEVIAKGVQEVEPAVFAELNAGDVLFIDSTHIVKTASDVVYELFDVLPALKPGVLIHFHDIHYPFEYPREWVMERNYSWNETYFLRAFLMHNTDFEIVFFNDFFAHAARGLVNRDAPAMLTNPGGGLWLRRKGN